MYRNCNCSVCCSVLQCVKVCCSVLQCVAVTYPSMHVYRTCDCTACCSVLQCVCSVLQCVAVCYSVLQCAAVCCSVLQCAAVCCSALQCVPVCVAVTNSSMQLYRTCNCSICCNLLQCVAVTRETERTSEQESVGVCVRVFVCVCACVCVHVCACMYLRVYACVYVRMRMRICVCVRVYPIRPHIYDDPTHTYVHMCTFSLFVLNYIPPPHSNFQLSLLHRENRNMIPTHMIIITHMLQGVAVRIMCVRLSLHHAPWVSFLYITYVWV